MKAWAKYTIAGVVFLIGAPGSVVYNQYLSPYLNDQTVYVATTNLNTNTPVSVQQNGKILVYFKPEKMKRTQVSPGAITNPQQLIGLYTAQSMSENQQFTNLTVEPNPDAIMPGTQDVPITSSWIAAMSPTLRQGDYVKIVPIPPNQTSVSVSNQSSSLSLQDLAGNQSPLDNIPVLYVHTTDNTEVTNAGTTSDSSMARDDGSGMPSNIDLLMTNTQASLLASYIQQGYKLFIWGIDHNTNPVNKG